MTICPLPPASIRSFAALVICFDAWICAAVFAADQPNILVGVAKVDVTPTVPVVLAGYGGRTPEYEGIDDKLWARALVIGDRQPVAVVALDNCGVTVPFGGFETVVNVKNGYEFFRHM